MNILGYEIDPTFVHTVHPIKIADTEHGYEYFFVLDFKDGRSHKVKISNNYSTLNYQGNPYSVTPHLSRANHKKMVLKKPKDGELIKKLRTDIISKMNK